MSSTPRIAMTEKALRMHGITDPLPMFSEEFRTLVRQTQLLAYSADALDRAVWDVLRVKMALAIDCGVCKHMRDVRGGSGAAEAITRMETPGQADLPAPLKALADLSDRFLAAPETIDADFWGELCAHHDDRALAQALLDPIFGAFHAKLIVVCGLEPASKDELTNVQFDSSAFSLEKGALSMIKADP